MTIRMARGKSVARRANAEIAPRSATRRRSLVAWWVSGRGRGVAIWIPKAEGIKEGRSERNPSAEAINFLALDRCRDKRAVLAVPYRALEAGWRMQWPALL